MALVGFTEKQPYIKDFTKHHIFKIGGNKYFTIN